MIKPFKFVTTDSKDLNQIQQNVDTVLRSLQARDDQDGSVLKDIEIVTGTPKKIAHKLQRKWSGFSIRKINADAAVWYSNADELSDIFIELNSSANVTVDIYVF